MKRAVTVESLTERTRAVIDTYLSNPTFTHAQLANAVGISTQRVSQILRNPRVTALYPILMRRTIQSRILPKALKAYEHLIQHGANEAVVEKASARVLANENVLDGPKLVIENNITLKSVSELREIVQKAAQVPAPIIEAELVEENPPNHTQPDTQ